MVVANSTSALDRGICLQDRDFNYLLHFSSCEQNVLVVHVSKQNIRVQFVWGKKGWGPVFWMIILVCDKKLDIHKNIYNAHNISKK